MRSCKRKQILKKRTATINELLHDRIINLKTLHIIFVAIIMNILGAYANWVSPFPLYYYFSAIFTVIAFIAVFTVRYFAREMDAIMIEISGEDKCRVAKYGYLRTLNAKWYYLIPFTMIILYAGTGIPMIQSFQLNCSMKYALMAFAVTVYFSILAYMQYISLAVFIYKVKCSNDKCLSYIEQIPANTKWIYQLCSLIKIYRNSFFCIGTLYIIAFGLFTLTGVFGVVITFSNIFLVLGWLVILVAIVIAFPVVSVLERSWITGIIRELKNLSTDKIKKTYTRNDTDKLQASDLIIAIWQTPEYPFKESISLFYASISAMANFITMIYYAKELFRA